MAISDGSGESLPKPYSRLGKLAREIGFAADVFRARPVFAVGYGVVVLVIFATIAAPILTPYEPEVADSAAYLLPPSLEHLMGTDNTGMDIFTRVLYALRIDLLIALLGTIVSAGVGVPLGAYIGFYEAKKGFNSVVATTMMRAADVLQAFPVLVFALCLVAVFGQSLLSIVVAIAFVNAPVYLRIMRHQVLTLRSSRFVEAAYIAGASDFMIMRRHLTPNASAPILSQLSVSIGWSILLTASLSFVGAGVEAPTPEWGAMIAAGFQSIMTGQWWPSVFPGMALGLTVFGFAVVGESIEILADPVARRKLAQNIAHRRKGEVA